MRYNQGHPVRNVAINGNGFNEVGLQLQTEEDRPTFRPFTRESLAQIEARIQEEEEKKRELEKKRQEGEVRQCMAKENEIFMVRKD